MSSSDYELDIILTKPFTWCIFILFMRRCMGIYYCKFRNVRENLIFANIIEVDAL